MKHATKYEHTMEKGVAVMRRNMLRKIVADGSIAQAALKRVMAKTPGQRTLSEKKCTFDAFIAHGLLQSQT